MIDVRLLLKFLDRDSVFKNLFLLLFAALFPTLDVWLLVFLGSIIPDYHNILLASLLGAGLTGFFGCFFLIRAELNEIKFMIKNGIYPERQFPKLAGSFFCAYLMITPGILSTLTALFLLIPALRTVAGRRLTRVINKDIKEVYEYIKLYEVEI